MTTFKTPKEFLVYIKKSEAFAYHGGQPSPQYQEIHREQQKQLEIERVDPEAFFDNHFDELLTLVSDILPEEKQAEVKQRIAVGCLDHKEVNAFIVPSDDGRHFAILINRAMITMLNHYIKLIAAALYPDSVIYCDGLPPGKLTKADYVKMSTQMLKKYDTTNNPIGPALKIAIHSDAMNFVENALVAIHLFILSHEVGHYINGDLSDPKNFKKCSWFKGAELFLGNSSHNKEFKADEFAFDATLRVLSNKGAMSSVLRAFDLSITLLFNFIREMSEHGCDSHPRSRDRLLSVTHTFLGQEAARLMQKSFNDTSVIQEFQRHIGNRTVAEVLNDRAK